MARNAMKPTRISGALALAIVALSSTAAHCQAPGPRTQVRFTGPTGMEVRWYTRDAQGKGLYSEPPLRVPGRLNFRQGAAYRLKLSHIEGHPGLELYPTLEVWPAGVAGQQFLAHSAVPLEVTEEDVRQVQAGGYVVKVIYFPANGAGLGAISGGDGAPGADPVQEAQRRGAVLLVLRLGNLDAELP
jgi:hypothetical protein